MTIDVPSAATAPYVHLRAAPGGRIKRWLLHQVLRIGVRNSKIQVEDIARLRRHNETFDRRFGKVDPALRRSTVDAGGVVAEWIELARAAPTV